MLISPINLNKWKPGEVISSSQAREEFLNVYNLVNGRLDAANFQNGSITSQKIADGAVGPEKIQAVPANKITGRLTASQLPTNLITSGGGQIDGTIIFNVGEQTPLIKNYDNEETVLYEGGTDKDKVRLIVGGKRTAVRIERGGTILWSLDTDGLETPVKLKIPEA